MIALDNIAREIHNGDNINRIDGIQRNYYNRARRIDIEELSGASLVDYQFSISDMVDGRDRIHNREGISQPFWVESTARTWTRGNVSANGRTNFVQYMDNSIASNASDGAATFEFFDDFDGTAIDTTRWEILNAHRWFVSGGELQGTHQDGRLLSYATFSAPIIQEVRMRSVVNATFGQTNGGFWNSTTDGFTFIPPAAPHNDEIRNNATQSSLGVVVAPRNNVPFLLRFTAWGTNINLTIINLNTGVTTFNTNYANTVSSERILLGRRSDDHVFGHAFDVFWDWIRIRRHTSPEPIVIVRGEIPLT